MNDATTLSARYPTPQAVFDKVWDHFITRGNPQARAPGGPCKYWIPDSGAKCAIGCLLTDEEAEAFEREHGSATCSVSKSLAIERVLDPDDMYAVARQLIALGVVPPDHAVLCVLSACQSAHDNSTVPGEFQEQLRDIAASYELEVPSKGGAQ